MLGHRAHLPAGELHRLGVYRAKRGCHLAGPAHKHRTLHALTPHADGGRVQEENILAALTPPLVADDLNLPRGAVFLCEDGDEVSLFRTRCEQRFHAIAERFSRAVVHIALELPNLARRGVVLHVAALRCICLNEVRAQNAACPLVVALAGPHARRDDAESGGQFFLRARCSHDGRACGCDELALHGQHVERDAMLGHRGAYGGYGYGQYAMRAAYGSASLTQEGNYDLVDVERVETHGRRYYVDDGVDGTHLVEVDLFRRGAVRLGLRLGQDLEHALCRAPCTLGQRAGVDDCKDIGQAAMLMMVVRTLVEMLALMRMMVAVVVSVLMGEIAPVFMFMAVDGLSVMYVGREFTPAMSVAVSVLVVVVIVAVLACTLMHVGMFVLMRMGVIVVVSGIIGLLVRMGARGVVFKMAVQPRHVVVMVCQLCLKPHVEVTGAHTVLRYLAHDDLVSCERQTCKRLAQVPFISPQIEQGRDDHVAADARCTFEIEGLSHEVVLSGGRMACS